jgi:hypothetical protein
VIGSKDKIARSSVGYKCDLIIRESKVQHEHVYEYCVGETAIQYQNTKTFEEKELKLPKTMKDMFDDLIIYNKNDHTNLAVFGIQHAGLSLTLLTTDRPTTYITRITHLKEHYIASDVAFFVSIILPLLILIWQVKQRIMKVKNHILSNQTQLNTSNNCDWLQNCLYQNADIAMPPHLLQRNS